MRSEPKIVYYNNEEGNIFILFGTVSSYVRKIKRVYFKRSRFTMKLLVAFLIRMFIAIPTAIAVWLISFFAFNQPFLIATAISIAGSAFVFWIIPIYMNYRFFKKNGLTRKEYRYIKKNLQEAKRKISRLHKALLSIRHLQSLKQRIEFIRIVRKIYSLTKKEPKRFYQAEPFYFSHLDSAVELSEKYVFLASQPKKTRELDQSLREALLTLEELQQLVEKDLYQVINDDIERLDFEIDVAKHSLKK